MQYQDLNLGNSIFKGFNDKNGLMICGYEYGFSKKDEKNITEEMVQNKDNVTFTFANKTPFLGDYFWKIRYDNTIAKWFELWGHPLNRKGLGGDFEKSIIQTNISDTQNNSVNDYNQIKSEIVNFLHHLEVLRPNVILFMGRQLTDYINNKETLPKIEEILGKSLAPRRVIQRETEGTKFKVFFQNFEKCQTVCFPHASGSWGLSLDYMAQFKPEMDELLTAYKKQKNFNC